MELLFGDGIEVGGLVGHGNRSKEFETGFPGSDIGCCIPAIRFAIEATCGGKRKVKLDKGFQHRFG